MRYIILTFISIALIIIGFAIKAHAEITSYSVPTEKTEFCNINRSDYKDIKIGTLSNGYEVYLSEKEQNCFGATVGNGYVIFNILTIETIIHESVHLAQREGGNNEDEARNTTKFFFEIINLL